MRPDEREVSCRLAFQLFVFAERRGKKSLVIEKQVASKTQPGYESPLSSQLLTPTKHTTQGPVLCKEKLTDRFAWNTGGSVWYKARRCSGIVLRPATRSLPITDICLIVAQSTSQRGPTGIFSQVKWAKEHKRRESQHKEREPIRPKISRA